MNGIELLSLLPEEFLIQLAINNRLVDIDGDLKSISNMLASGETSKETAMLGGGVPRVAGIYDHASDVAHGLVNLLKSAVREALSELGVDGLLVIEV